MFQDLNPVFHIFLGEYFYARTGSQIPIKFKKNGNVCKSLEPYWICEVTIA